VGTSSSSSSLGRFILSLFFLFVLLSPLTVRESDEMVEELDMDRVVLLLVTLENLALNFPESFAPSSGVKF